MYLPSSSITIINLILLLIDLNNIYPLHNSTKCLKYLVFSLFNLELIFSLTFLAYSPYIQTICGTRFYLMLPIISLYLGTYTITILINLPLIILLITITSATKS